MHNPTHSVEEIQGLHSALMIACGFPPLRLSPADARLWWEVLHTLEPLTETPEGKLAPKDIQEVVGEMKRQNKAKVAKWALRPTNILRDPEKLRDLVLEARQRRNARPRRPMTQTIVECVDGVSRLVEKPVEDTYIDASTAALEELNRFRKASGL